jgi:hypothetical protein
MLIATVGSSSDRHADVIQPSLLWSLVAMGVLTSAHPSLLDSKHNLHLFSERKHNCIQFLKENTIRI